MPAVDRQERQEREERSEKGKAVELAVGQIEKQFGKGSIMRLGQKGAIQPIDSIPTGSISIDYALGVGGVPRGRVIEIFGPESSGKTTLSLHVIAEAHDRALAELALNLRERGLGGFHLVIWYGGVGHSLLLHRVFPWWSRRGAGKVRMDGSFVW